MYSLFRTTKTNHTSRNMPNHLNDKFAECLQSIVTKKKSLIKHITNQNNQNNKLYFPKYVQTSSLNGFDLLLTTKKNKEVLVKCITDQNDQNNKSYFLKYTQTSSLNAFNLLLTTKKKKSLVKCITDQNRSEQPEQQIILPEICPEKFAKRYRPIVSKHIHRLEQPKQQIILLEMCPIIGVTT